jgi:hypothetical protein
LAVVQAIHRAKVGELVADAIRKIESPAVVPDPLEIRPFLPENGTFFGKNSFSRLTILRLRIISESRWTRAFNSRKTGEVWFS